MPRSRRGRVLCAVLCGVVLGAPWSCVSRPAHDVVLRGGWIHDGSGAKPYRGDVALRGDRIVAVGEVAGLGALEIDASGRVVAPGFINMLSWATESLWRDGASESDLRQGVTLEVFGEGWSMGPLNEAMRESLAADDSNPFDEVPWTTLAGYLEALVARGIAPNVASFVGATTLRIHEVGYENRPATAAELGRMQELLREEMEAGALGLGSALIYAPATYSSTAELTALARVAAEYDGMYITHLRSEGNRLLESVAEMLEIVQGSGVAAEIYHLKAAGADNWDKLDAVIAIVEAARAAGWRITANIYTYDAGATGLNAIMPPWVQEGGHAAWVERLQDPAVRERLELEMNTPTDEWENFLLLSGGADRILLVGFLNEELRRYTGWTLQAVADDLGRSPADAAMELVVRDNSRVEAIFFLMSEENLRRKVKLPWVGFCSDEASLAPRGMFLDSRPHPRAYGSFARLLGRFVRDEGLVPLPEAIRRLTSQPAIQLGLTHRGSLRPGYFADVVVFDPETIQDRATYAEPHQFAVGVEQVFVNGRQVLRDGEPTGVAAGSFVRGPGHRVRP